MTEKVNHDFGDILCEFDTVCNYISVSDCSKSKSNGLRNSFLLCGMHSLEASLKKCAV
jgi:hypothetical protein